jgi:mannan endo-1,4-beta-mannosidase
VRRNVTLLLLCVAAAVVSLIALPVEAGGGSGTNSNGRSVSGPTLHQGHHVINALLSEARWFPAVKENTPTAGAISTKSTNTTSTNASVITAPATSATPLPGSEHPARSLLPIVGSQKNIVTPQPAVGLNAYELATDYGVNNGCGADVHTSTDAFFASLPQGTVVRFWAFQAFGTGATGTPDANALNWASLDSVFSAAAQYGDKLIPVLGNEWAACDGVDDQPGVQKGDSFFSGGYKNNSDEGALPYYQWVQDIVSRYAASSAVYAWEPINEPEDCGVAESQGVADLTSFYTAIGGQIHALSPGSKVEAGFLGTGECGLENGDYETVGASPGIDILSYHDYYSPTTAVGGDQYNGIGARITQAKAVGKPIVAGEMGITAGNGCAVDLAQREADFRAKISAQFALGTALFLLWDWYPGQTMSCAFENITTGDPALSLLHGT